MVFISPADWEGLIRTCLDTPEWGEELVWFLSWDNSSILRLFILELLSKMSMALSRSSWFFNRMESSLFI